MKISYNKSSFTMDFFYLLHFVDYGFKKILYKAHEIFFVLEYLNPLVIETN